MVGYYSRSLRWRYVGYCGSLESVVVRAEDAVYIEIIGLFVASFLLTTSVFIYIHVCKHINYNDK